MGGWGADAQTDAQGVHGIRHFGLMDPVPFQCDGMCRAVVAGFGLVFPHHELARRHVDHVTVVCPEHGGAGLGFIKDHRLFGRRDGFPGGQRSDWFRRRLSGLQVAGREQQNQ